MAGWLRQWRSIDGSWNAAGSGTEGSSCGVGRVVLRRAAAAAARLRSSLQRCAGPEQGATAGCPRAPLGKRALGGPLQGQTATAAVCRRARLTPTHNFPFLLHFLLLGKGPVFTRAPLGEAVFRGGHISQEGRRVCGRAGRAGQAGRQAGGGQARGTLPSAGAAGAAAVCVAVFDTAGSPGAPSKACTVDSRPGSRHAQ